MTEYLSRKSLEPTGNPGSIDLELHYDDSIGSQQLSSCPQRLNGVYVVVNLDVRIVATMWYGNPEAKTE